MSEFQKCPRGFEVDEFFALLGMPPLARSLNSTFPALKSVTIQTFKKLSSYLLLLFFQTFCPCREGLCLLKLFRYNYIVILTGVFSPLYFEGSPPYQFLLQKSLSSNRMVPLWVVSILLGRGFAHGQGQVAQSCLTLCNSMDCSPPGSSVHGDSPDKNTGVACCSLLQGVHPTQGSNPGLPHCREILYHLSHQGSPRILEWVAYPVSRGSSQPRN